MKHLPILLGAALALGIAACGDDTGDAAEGGGGSTGDGKLHPPGNGTPVDEAPACDRLHGALGAKATELGCVATFRTCPGLIQSLTGDSCHAYDDGSLGGCVTHFKEATDCDDLKARAEGCVPETIGAPPDGCPE